MISIAPGSSPLAMTARHRIARLLQGAIAGEHRVKTFRPRKQLQRDLERDAEQALVAREQPAPVRADRFAARAAPLDDLARGEHGFDAEHVIRRHAVFQAMRAAGIERDVSADRADASGWRDRARNADHGAPPRCVT